MQAPPALSLKCTKSRLAGGLIAALSAISFLWVALWGFDSSDSGEKTLLLVFLAVVQPALLRWSWSGISEGRLEWSGETWYWLPARENGNGERSVLVSVCIDLMQAQLLRLQPESGPAFWLWVDRYMEPSLWQPLQRALVWHQSRTRLDKAASK